jgi:hypothetical protein
MISRLVLRFDAVLGATPQAARLRGVRRQLWAREQVNLALVVPSLVALEPLAPSVLLMGAAGWQARSVALAQDALDIIDLLVDPSCHAATVDVLLQTGWTIAPTQAAKWQNARILWLSKGKSGRLRLHLPKALAGFSEGEGLSAPVGPDQTLQFHAAQVTVPTLVQSLSIAVSHSVSRHSTGDQWLFDLAFLQSKSEIATDTGRLPATQQAQAQAMLAWAQAEAGLWI